MSHLSGDKPIIRPTLHHFNLKTTRLQEMIAWYITVVGMASNYQFPGGAWLTNDEANHRLALLTSPQLSEDPDKLMHTGIHHSAFEYATMGDLLDTYSRLKALGIEPHACLDHGMTTSFYYEDPDGNSVELQSDNFGTWQESSAWMRTSPQFAADPIGMPVDPDRMVAVRQTGASFAELHQRAYAGEFKPAGPLDLHVPLGDPRAPL
ncbi:MAG: VOC family protein [Herpetosiphonaceae bacterium]|nr:VOC family protein [Herpetosiphonaceae bacterium]